MAGTLERAIASIKSGDKKTGRLLLTQLLKEDPRNERAWLWLSTVVESEDQKRTCLKRALKLNPNNEAAKRRLAELGSTAQPQALDIDKLTGHEFELLVVRLLKKMGLTVQETKNTADGGIDAIARSDAPVLGGLFVVQCKRYSSNVGEPTIRDLYGVVNHMNASKGILITNADFTQQARRFAEGKPIELINGSTLQSLLKKYDFGPEVTVPKDKVLIRIPSSFWRFGKALTNIAERIDASLRSDSIPVYSATSNYDISDFTDLVKRTTRVYITEIENLYRVLSQGVFTQDPDTLNNDYVDRQSRVIRQIVDNLLKQRKELVNTRIEEEWSPLKEALVDFETAALKECARTLRKAYQTLEDVDGDLVDKGSTVLIDVGEFKVDERIMTRLGDETERLVAWWLKKQ